MTSALTIHVNRARSEMFTVIDHRCMIAVFPKSTLLAFSTVAGQFGPARNQLHGFWDNVSTDGIEYDQVD